MTRDDMQKVLEIGISLSEEKDFNRLYITVKMYPCSGGTDTGCPEL